jgi:uncharacterized membrane protein
MLVAGIVLVLVGVAILYFAEGHRAAHFGGGALILLGVIALIVWLVDRSGADTAGVMLAMAAVPPGRPLAHMSHGEGDTRPVPDLPAQKAEPVVLAFIVAAVPIVCAFILQVLEATDVLDNALWIRTLLTGLGALTGALAAAWARARVTPTAAPKLNDGTLLAPMAGGS